jgi:predicted Zn-ribbon and HTH transcriptional regulator
MIISKKRAEEKLMDIKFNIHKFTNKPKENVIIISCFSEFGCEVVGVLYCIPRIKRENPDAYIIVMGWYGRAYLYKHLVDEYWETQEEAQWLRDYALAFHHSSRNLKKIEKAVSKMGRIITAESMGKIAVGNKCNGCGHFWGQIENVRMCPKCSSFDLLKALFADVSYWRTRMTPVPKPSQEKMELASRYLGENPVAIIARNRVTYGRNLPAEFYVKLVKKLQKMGYTPIWLGEKQCTLACPVEDVIDLRAEARDLELTLAIVSQCRFTVQFWTASTRLAALMGTPYLLFESPDQIFGNGQEAYRLSLCTRGNRKLVYCNYLNVYNDHDTAVNLVERCVKEMGYGDWSDVIGMVDEPSVVEQMRSNGFYRLV